MLQSGPGLRLSQLLCSAEALCPLQCRGRLGTWNMFLVEGVSPLMIVLLWLLSIWKNMGVNKMQHLLG